MHSSEGFAQAFATIRGHKLRSFLLILGVAIGVATLLAMFTIVTGLSGRIKHDIVQSAKPYLYVARYHGLGGEDMDEVLRRPQLMPECIEPMRQIEGVDGVDYMISSGRATVLTYGKERTNLVQVFGASADFHNLYSYVLGEGRFFTYAEQDARTRVCVLGAGPAETLFPNTDPIGKRLRLFGVDYQIVGVMESSRHIMGQMGDNWVVIPWPTYEKDFSNTDRDDRTMAVTVADGHDSDEVATDVTGVLRRIRGLRPGEENDFEVVASETYGELVGQVTQAVALVLVVMSSIGLMVGGIGVMNIMLISVTERTREIGVRMAVGARRQDVLRQILVESATLTGIGGIVGTTLGYLLAWGSTKVLAFPFGFNPLVAVAAVAFSASIGIFFGLYPANRAARMDPIEALRHE
jgi:putative ABC transport system permease protein